MPQNGMFVDTWIDKYFFKLYQKSSEKDQFKSVINLQRGDDLGSLLLLWINLNISMDK